MSLVIRRAQSGEAGLVLAFIRELAEYEKLLHEVEATEAGIGAALFCDNPRLFCEIAEWNGEAVGFTVWFLNFSTFSGRYGIYLEDLFVRPAFRGKGIGKALLADLARTCVKNGWSRLQLTRPTRPLPTMKINPDVKDIFGFRYEDFSLEGYDPHPHIKAEVAV